MSSANIETEGLIVMSGWAQKQRNPRKHLTGITVVLAVHGIVLWLILSGMGQQFVKAVVPKSIVEVLFPPEPPPPPPKPQPKLDTPPPPPDTYIPPPEVAPTVTSNAPVIFASPTPPPPQAVYVPAPPAPPRPVGPRGFGSIKNRPTCVAAFMQSFPRDARRSGTEGVVTLLVTVGPDGRSTGVEVKNSNPRRIFDRAAMGVIQGGACLFETDTASYTAELVITYKLSGEGEE